MDLFLPSLKVFPPLIMYDVCVISHNVRIQVRSGYERCESRQKIFLLPQGRSSYLAINKNN